MKKKIIGAMIAASMIGGTSVPALAKTTDNSNINCKVQVNKKLCSSSNKYLGFTIGQVGENNIKDCIQNIINNNYKPSNPDNNIEENDKENNEDNTVEDTNQNNKPEDNLENDKDDISNDNNLEVTLPNTDNDNSNSENTNPPAADDEQQDNFMAQVEQLIYQKVNEERAKVGISQLSYNSTMEKYARIKSKDMGDNNYFSHEDLSGKLITEKMKQDGVSYKAWGENIAYIGGVSDANKLAEQFMTNWMNSSGHRANILSTNFESIGIGVYKSGNRVYATQEFYK